jgi:predicted nucleotidyltransferase
MVANSFLFTGREEILGVVTRHGGRNARISGSQTLGEAEPDNDVAVLIDLEPGRSLLDIVAMFSRCIGILFVDQLDSGGFFIDMLRSWRICS